MRGEEGEWGVEGLCGGSGGVFCDVREDTLVPVLDLMWVSVHSL